MHYVFSREQLDINVLIAKKTGRSYKPKTVVVNGKKKQYTDIVSDMKNIRYVDSILITTK